VSGPERVKAALTAASSLTPRPNAAPSLSPEALKRKRLDDEIDGLRDARRLLADAQHITRWGCWRGRESSHHALHAIASAREKIGRDLKKLRIERAALEEWLP
jgi:hypothetical protein